MRCCSIALTTFEAAGDYRRRVEVIEEISFVVETDDFTSMVENFLRFGGRTPLVTSDNLEALFAASAGILVRFRWALEKEWGLELIVCTGSKPHLKKLSAVTGALKAVRTAGSWPSEADFYDHFGLEFIEPELREGHDEVDCSASGTLAEKLCPPHFVDGLVGVLHDVELVIHDATAGSPLLNAQPERFPHVHARR
jgi:DNA polymerase/3'-5' exonuclease PolX